MRNRISKAVPATVKAAYLQFPPQSLSLELSLNTSATALVHALTSALDWAQYLRAAASVTAMTHAGREGEEREPPRSFRTHASIFR